MKSIITICARGGSKGVPGKNIRELCGRPLIVHTIEQALEVSNMAGVFVSTDCKEIAAIAEKSGAIVPFIRPKELATDRANKLDVIEHLVEYISNKIGSISKIIDLDPTSPLRSMQDINDSIKLLDADTDVVITGYEAEKNPYFNMVEQKDNGNIGLVKQNQIVSGRQLAPKVYAMNGSVYVWHGHSLTKGLWGGNVKLHVMPRERSIDIDSEIDFRIVEFIMNDALVSNEV